MSVEDFFDIVCPFAGGVRLTVRAKPGVDRGRLALKRQRFNAKRESLVSNVKSERDLSNSDSMFKDRALSRARDIKIVDIGNGKRAIEVSVSADAKEGKANRALIERLSGELGVTKKKITIKSGETGRLKIVEIQGDEQALVQSVKALLAIS